MKTAIASVFVALLGLLVACGPKTVTTVPSRPPAPPPPPPATAAPISPTGAALTVPDAPPLPAPSTAGRVGNASEYPDPTRTPGALNPQVTQATIDQTICNPDWSTKSIRLPSSYTTNLKKQQMAD